VKISQFNRLKVINLIFFWRFKILYRFANAQEMEILKLLSGTSVELIVLVLNELNLLKHVKHVFDDVFSDDKLKYAS
jgi:hypothetical protein